ncbi:MAG TPA: hypothetical protein VLG49_06805 [Rhabdochlamydiaceae bacterium]|nr:hypothetical protein [Rhabdochlamydiaceae bacterium]
MGIDPIQNEPTPKVGGPSPIPQGGPGGPSNAESPFRKMFGGNMTQKEFTQFINQFLKDMISQFKAADARWKAAMEHLKKTESGDE